jgi:hypothetical protein
LLHKTPETINRETFLPSARSLAVRKLVWKEAGGFPEWLSFAGEDTLFLEQVKRAGHAVTLVPEAIVYWRPRGSVWTYSVQQYRYGVGDGESRLYPVLFLKRLVLIAGVACVALGIAGDLLLAASGMLILAWGFMRLIWPKHALGVPLWRLVPLFLLALAGEAGQVLGYIRGLLRKGG